MICIKCANDKHEVIRTDRNRTSEGKFSELTDLRVYRCVGCGLVTFVDCRITKVEVFNGRKISSQAVTVDEYKTKWLEEELKVMPRRSESLFGGEND